MLRKNRMLRLFIFLMSAWILGEAFITKYVDADERLLGMRSGGSLSYGLCPCYRWTLTVQGPSGTVKIGQFLISSDALLEIQNKENLALKGFAQRLYQFGKFEVLPQSGRIGIAFDGVTIGEDRDYGYSDIIQTGIYGVLILAKQQNLNLKVYSGIDVESKSVNLGPKFTEKKWQTEALFHWNSTGRWSSDIRLYAAKNLDGFKNVNSTELFALGNIALRLFSIHNVDFNFGMEWSAHQDRNRIDYGFNDVNNKHYTGGLFIDVEWER